MKQVRRGKKRNAGAAEDGIIKGLLIAIAILALLMLYLNAFKAGEEGFTQIYLNENGRETEGIAGHPYAFRFTIENFEGHDVVYEYQVLVADEQIIEKKVILKEGDQRSISETVPSLDNGENRVRIFVQTDSEEDPLSLYFYVYAR
ncbi:hypothetical protein KJ765_04490 [Candidatus Micrarchaeota archaeon]|nr:hypothetical protein [Candidatus Micrarchaeota archaeon]